MSDVDEHDELGEREQQALDAWTPLTPPAGFAQRVMAARSPERAQPPRRRWPLAVGAALVGAAAGALVVVWAARTGSRSDAGALPDSAERATAAIGDRAIADAEPRAQMSWSVNVAGDAEIEQTSGDVFYRVDRGGPFIVHTPAGDVRVTGTCFRVEVDAMNHRKQIVLSGAVGAALAAAVVVTVYEGHVVAETKTAKTELPAGSHATIAADGRTIVAAREDGAPALDAQSTREQLLLRTQSQRTEIAQLRARLADVEKKAGRTGDHVDSPPEEGRAWHDPSPEKLLEWAAQCHVRVDEPNLDGWQPLQNLGKNERGLEPGELAAYNAAIGEVANEWRQLVRSVYVEVTGDTQGVETLSIEAMRREIENKSNRDDLIALMQKISAERAGLAQAPADPSKLSSVERLVRRYVQLGDATEAALAKRLGPARARDIRGDAWGSRSDFSGCPDKN